MDQQEATDRCHRVANRTLRGTIDPHHHYAYAVQGYASGRCRRTTTATRDSGQRMLSPRQGGMVIGEPLFDDVNLSGSNKEGNGSFPSLLASPRASEPDVARTPSSVPEPVNGVNLPLPMAVPVATSTPTSAK
ncbi:hypothetical protein PHYPSEUDO_014604 [Phytophthora pseudosyringae]|uniref:Uncharacterized protein n=1 Tax=Phytophthora pseudosyringae TaxID=221518 RepID=A0A8T1W0C1_9STRA|nr:hypothetical protein PHYPSEUDO_014604 [Phytophthora pseudosyringae]